MSGATGRRLDDTIWFCQTELEFRCALTPQRIDTDPVDEDDARQQTDAAVWSMQDSFGNGLSLVPDDQPTSRTRFRLASVSSSGSALCSHDYVSIWTCCDGGKCLALTGPVDDSLFRGTTLLCY